MIDSDKLSRNLGKRLSKTGIFSIGHKNNIRQVPFLCHYTSANALEKILRNNTLWLSKSDYLNDKTEIEYAMGLVEDILIRQRNIHKNTDKHIRNMLDQAKDMFEETYIFSTSWNIDSLTLWSNYSDLEGYSLIFDQERLLRTLQRNNALFFDMEKRIKPKEKEDYYILTNKVIYEYDEQTRIIEQVIDLLNEFFICEKKSSEEIMPYIITHTFINTTAKHNAGQIHLPNVQLYQRGQNRSATQLIK